LNYNSLLSSWKIIIFSDVNIFKINELLTGVVKREMQTITAITTGIPGGTLFIADAFIIVIITLVFISIIHRRSQSLKDREIGLMKPSLSVLISSLFIIALYAPAYINIYLNFGYSFVVGMCWQIPSYGSFYFSILNFIVGLPFMFFRIVFVYYIYKYYLRNATLKRVIIVGILSEVQFSLFGLVFLLNAIVNPYITIIFSVPIPILFIVGLLIIRTFPRPEGTSVWTKSKESNDWWEEEQKETSVSDNE